MGSVNLNTNAEDVIPRINNEVDAHSGKIAAVSEGSQNGRTSKSDSPLTSFPPMEDAIEVIRKAIPAVADCRIARDLSSHNLAPILTLPITKELQKPRASPL